mmetsp:Transcript_9223/g.14186  ORF Transcript_9223/g.14186 Transcript_9223/m.14186 type:complete len:178 (+) Transcript_9223:4078-4611(+)|eukprot:CAMPEP_0178939060 /NCGR_PEP_ID=MMETSP0786-20121207/26673_1 /TAXON_ID=186022 /ORGANISM="Thalassionema frauenfeldii, Strain CCMP 1798" /LENGTH=177 /DNA_ID=CAMNT_0020617841 /DNA_START=1321 /DNA_END=1854 /DNA_ORIENTATION=-
MAGDEFLEHVPLNLNAFKGHLPLRSWMKDALPGRDWVFLDEEGWYGKAFEDSKGKYVWAPPPCVANVCLEQMCEVWHIHPHFSHLFLCPAIMMIDQRKQLTKHSDSMFVVKEGAPIWPTDMLEPMMISLTVPLLPHRLWMMRRSEWVASRKGSLLEMFRSSAANGRSYLRKFWSSLV